MWENTVATEGMLGNLNPLGDGPGRSLADHGARVPEVLPAAELEGFLTGLIIAMPREPVLVMMVPPGDLLKRHSDVDGTRLTPDWDVFDCWWALFDHRAAENRG